MCYYNMFFNPPDAIDRYPDRHRQDRGKNNTDLKTLILPSNKTHLTNWHVSQSLVCVAIDINSYVVNGIEFELMFILE